MSQSKNQSPRSPTDLRDKNPVIVKSEYSSFEYLTCERRERYHEIHRNTGLHLLLKDDDATFGKPEDSTYRECRRERGPLRVSFDPQLVPQKLDPDNRPSLFTNFGTLMGHDDTIEIKFTRSWVAFAGMTWRLHQGKLKNTGQTDLSVCLKPMKTLSYTTTLDGPELASMIVEYRGVVSAVIEVKKNLLLATQMDVCHLTGESDKLAMRIQGLNSDSDAIEKGSTPTDTNTTPSLFEDAAKTELSTATRSSKLSKLSILSLKAEGMAEFVLQQYPGNMPPDFD